MKRILISLVCFAFVGFALWVVFGNRYVPADYIVMANQIISDVADELTQRYNMRVIGVTAGMADSVNVVGLSFQIHGPLSKEQLRRILIDSVQEFLNRINSNEKLRPFLKNYPFTEKEVIITLFIIDSRGIRMYDPDIAIASSYAGTISYNTKDKNIEFGYKQEIEEDYKTALQIVQDEKNHADGIRVPGFSMEK